MYSKQLEQKKTKNSNGLFPSSFLNNKQKNNQISFSNAFKGNNPKQKLQNFNNNKKLPNKDSNSEQQAFHNNNNKKVYENYVFRDKESGEFDEEDIKEVAVNNPINNRFDKEKEIIINNNDINEENLGNKKLSNVASFKNIDFLLPKKNNLNENNNNIKKIEKNRRYINQGDYDFDGNTNSNININNQFFGIDFSDKKKNNNDQIIKKDKTINMSQSEYEENDSNIEDSDIEKLKENDTYSEENLEKLKRQEELIKKLMKYKSFQRYIKLILKNKKIGINKKGKKIKWTLFRKYLYELPFLDLYYQHRIPFIIMRPRLDVIKRKREKKQKEMYERMKMEEESKNYQSRI